MLTGTRLETGAIVMSGDGKRLGIVKEIALDRFKLDRRLQPDMWLAIEYVDHTSEGLVQLVLPSSSLGAARVEAPR